jgi:hypothetical protein
VLDRDEHRILERFARLTNLLLARIGWEPLELRPGATTSAFLAIEDRDDDYRLKLRIDCPGRGQIVVESTTSHVRRLRHPHAPLHDLWRATRRALA